MAEAYYWLTGSAGYLGGNIMLLLYLSAFLNWINNDSTFSRLVLTVLLIPAMGFNEVQTIFLLIIHLFLTVHAISKRSTHLPFILFLTALSVGLLLILSLSPGNVTRIHQYQENFNWFYSVGMSVLQTGRFLLLWMINPL